MLKKWLLKQLDESPNASWFLFCWCWLLVAIFLSRFNELFIISYMISLPFFGVTLATILAHRYNLSTWKSLYWLLWLLPVILLFLSSVDESNKNLPATIAFLSWLWVNSVYRLYRKDEKNEEMTINKKHKIDNRFLGFFVRHPILCYLPIIFIWIYFESLIVFLLLTIIYTFVIAYLRDKSMIWWLVPVIGLLVVSSDESI